MNAVEIEEAISQLAEQEFDSAAFPYAFLEAFGNKSTTIKRLKSGSSNASDIEGGVLQRNNIHITVCAEGAVTGMLDRLKASPATGKAKAKFVLATDGQWFEAEDLNSGETVTCTYSHFPDHFGFFLPLAGISTVKEIRNNAVDIKATGRLNRLYVELLKDNEDWATDAHRHEMNQFMARLIFCFFAEDTDIFNGDDLFTSTVEQMSDSRSGNTQDVIGELFRAMDTKHEDRVSANLPRWACVFPWVNGGLFEGCKEIPKFSRIARSYLLHAGRLDWKKINPDIFGSMIQAVAHDDERGDLGMHYTSVPNILKVLNPLFLDGLREQLEKAGDNSRKLLNLRKRISNIRVFDPACGSGNFLVIAYIKMREIEAEAVRRRGEPLQKSLLKLENFYGIEIKDFAVEVARLSLLIAEFQCDVRFIGQKEAKTLMLPLKKTGQIHQGNALRMNWQEVCLPTGTGVKLVSDDLFNTPLEQPEIDFENRGGETYICGNPPYKGSQSQGGKQKGDLEAVFERTSVNWKGVDYVAGWFKKASDYCDDGASSFAFVSTNSICQGKAVSGIWPYILGSNLVISFAYTSFKWSNLAAHNAGVTVVIVGVAPRSVFKKRLFITVADKAVEAREVKCINAYLVSGLDIYVQPRNKNLSGLSLMAFGNMPIDGGFLSLTNEEIESAGISEDFRRRYIRKIYAPLWNMALIASRLHLIWIATVCGKLKTDFRYSNTMGWNTFPVPTLTEKNKADLTRCAKDILLAREAHFPATIAELYNPDKMPEDLRHAHERNDEVLERIYIGRRFRNDTERLEKLFELYTKMTNKKETV